MAACPKVVTKRGSTRHCARCRSAASYSPTAPSPPRRPSIRRCMPCRAWMVAGSFSSMGRLPRRSLVARCRWRRTGAAVRSALAANAEPLRFALANRYRHGAADAFAHLNAALAADGLVLRIPDGAALEKPLHIVHVSSGTQGDSGLARAPADRNGQGRQRRRWSSISSRRAMRRNWVRVVSDVVAREGSRLGPRRAAGCVDRDHAGASLARAPRRARRSDAACP